MIAYDINLYNNGSWASDDGPEYLHLRMVQAAEVGAQRIFFNGPHTHGTPGTGGYVVPGHMDRLRPLLLRSFRRKFPDVAYGPYWRPRGQPAGWPAQPIVHFMELAEPFIDCGCSFIGIDASYTEPHRSHLHAIAERTGIETIVEGFGPVNQSGMLNQHDFPRMGLSRLLINRTGAQTLSDIPPAPRGRRAGAPLYIWNTAHLTLGGMTAWEHVGVSRLAFSQYLLDNGYAVIERSIPVTSQLEDRP